MSRPGGARIPEHSCPGSHAAAIRPPRPGPRQGPPSYPHFIVRVARGPQVLKVRSLTELCGLRLSVESYVAPKGPLQCKRCRRFEHTQCNCGYAPRCVACGGSHLSGGCSTPREQPQCCGCRGETTRSCMKLKEAKVALVKQAPEHSRKNAITAHAAAPKVQRAGPSAKQMDLG